MASSKKIMLTTSRNPTPRIRTFCNDLSQVISGIVRVSRGKMSIDEVAEKALEHDADQVVIVDRWHGGPCQIKFFRVGDSDLVSVPPIVHISNIKLQRELGVSKAKLASSLVLSASDTSEEMLKVAETFSEFFRIPMLSIDEAVRNSPTLMLFSRGKTKRIVITFMVEPKHVEVGPRIAVSNVEW